jgi:hypothetical protein
MGTAVTGHTKTTHLPGLVKDIRAQSYTYMTQEGVMKALVTPMTGTGNAYTEPYFDPTAQSSYGAATEGTDITAATTISTTRKTYTASEKYDFTIMTERSVAMNTEQTRKFHAEHHGYTHAHGLESVLLTAMASLTQSISATGGLTWAKIAAARTLIENVPKAAPKPYSLVISPEAFYWFAASMVGTSNYYVQDNSLSGELQRKYKVASLVGGVNVYQSSHFTTATATTTHVCGLFSKAALGLFIPSDLDYTLRDQWDLSLRSWELLSTMTYAQAVRIPAYGTHIHTKAYLPS